MTSIETCHPSFLVPRTHSNPVTCVALPAIIFVSKTPADGRAKENAAAPSHISSLRLENTRDSAYELRYDVVSMYSSRKLTFSKDKFPVLAGVVAHVQQHTRDVFIAGLWKGYFLRHLLWRTSVDIYHKESSPGEHQPVARYAEPF
jgi:hypothetical protein